MKFKSLIFSLLLSFVGASAALAYGTIPFSLTQQFNGLGQPLSGGQLYLIKAATTSTPQNCFQDTALTLPYPNPLTLDSAGRVPQLFCADGSIKVRLQDKNGVVQVVVDNILVVGPSGGGGGGGTVDPTTISATGDVKDVYGVAVISGWVRLNGRTIGNALSGATERANADTQALFVYLWNTDPNLLVIGGRGANALADFTSNHQITLPDQRGRARAGLDDMGNSPASRLTPTYFGASGGCSSVLAITLGAACGGESQTLTAIQLPSITSNANNNISINFSGNGYSVVALNNGSALLGQGTRVQDAAVGNIWAPTAGTNQWGLAGSVTSLNNIGVTSNNTAGQPHPTVQPTILITSYIKL